MMQDIIASPAVDRVIARVSKNRVVPIIAVQYIGAVVRTLQNVIADAAK